MQLGMRAGKLGINLRIIGRDRKSRVQGLDRGGIAPLVELSVGQRQMELQIIGRILQRCNVLLFRLIEKLQVAVRGGARQVNRARLAEQLLGFVGFLQRRAPVVKLQLREGQAKVGDTVGGLQVERGVEVVNRGVRILQIVEHVTTIYVTLHHLRIARHGFGVVLHRLLKKLVLLVHVAGEQRKIRPPSATASSNAR